MPTEDYIDLHILEDITDRFSELSRIGRGGYADVYKGVYGEREIAVKWLHVDTLRGIDDKQFKNEVVNLLNVNHPNIVEFVGYCYAIKKILVEYNGSNFSDRIYRVLCFEYLQGGSLDKYLYGQSFAPNWSTRYMIIKGICEGLYFLHNRQQPILHLDLKPANILLDSSMVPKVADFGLSRVFSGSHTHVTKEIVGTKKYMPPEFITKGEISDKNDVFSLGVVMIEIMIGSSGHSSSIEMEDVPQLTQQAFKNCSNLIEDKTLYREAELHQLETCISIAKRCVDPKKENRHTMAVILDILKKTENKIPKRQLEYVLPGSTTHPKSTVAKRLKMDPAANVDNISNEHKYSDRVPRDISNINVQQVCDRETVSYVGETLIIGRDKEIEKILSILSESIKQNMVIVPIYGIGGIGKTTLAKLVFNAPRFHEYHRAWVYVSQEFNLMKIANSILSQLGKETSYIAQIQHDSLRKLFTHESILIVLDDLWEEAPRKLDDLMSMLKLGTPRRLIVIVTTRVEAIARKVCGQVGTPYKLEILTDDMCWTIIKEKTAFESRNDKKQLEHIGWEIAQKCGGVALAAQSLGYMLSEMDNSDEWESVRNSYIWNLSTLEGSSSRNEDEVLASLQLSYSKMPLGLKLCFSYCAVFLKGHNLVKNDLIHQWIAHGFPEAHEVLDSMQLCESYVTKLLGMSFLEYSKASPSDGIHGKVGTLFKMHDLVHDLARVTLGAKVNKRGDFVESSCHYALLTDCSKPLSVASPTNLKSLHFLDCGRIELCVGAFCSAKCLLVLDLSKCIIKNLPDSIGQLKKLRFLHAPRIKNWISNSISELSELTYLNLRESPEITLPESIGNMKGLMHLDLSGCEGIYELPASFAELKQLVHLDLSHCFVSTSDAFGGFTKLQYLNLCYFSVYRADKLTPDRTGLAKVMSNLIKLRYLNLSACMHLMGDEVYSLLDSIGTLPNLEHIDFSDNYVFSNVPESFGNLSKLHTFDISNCRHIKKLPASMVASRKVLFLTGRLDASVLSPLKIASLPYFEVCASSDECSSNISWLLPTNPDRLMVNKLENVMSTEEAQHIKLKEKLQIKSLDLEWTIGAERFVDDKEVLEKLLPPSSVQILRITGYMSVSIPCWLMGTRHDLSNLFHLALSDFPMCNNLPPLGQLPNLISLYLGRMGSLEEWNTEYTSGEECADEVLFPKLRSITIEKCANLRITPCLPRAILYLRIEDCDVLLSSWGENSSRSGASHVTKLCVKGSNLAISEWKLLHHLPALQKLTIDSCSVLNTPIEIIPNIESLCLTSLSADQAELPSWLLELKSLHKLKLKHCKSMISLPEWLGKLTSLKSFKILCCDGIRSLPDSVQQLTMLENLYIEGRPELEQWCDAKENKIKLAHIKWVRLNIYSDSDSDEEDGADESCEEDTADESYDCKETSDDSDEEEIEETDEETTNSQDTASGS